MKRVNRHKCDEVIRFFDLDFDIVEEITKMGDDKKYLIFYKKTPFGGTISPMSGKGWKLCIPEIQNPKIKPI
jgi:hypothetical protein